MAQGWARFVVSIACACALLAGACSSDDGAPSAAAPSSTASDDGGSETTTTEEEPMPELVIASPTALGCDELDPTTCMLPFPNDAFTVQAETPTGRQLALPDEGMPTNEDGTPITTEELDRLDGFSPGSSMLVFVPGVDVEASRIAPSTDIGASLDDDAPIVLIDTETGERVPHWGELDAHATRPASRLLLIRPAVSLTEGHRYAIGLRDLRDEDGEPVEPSEGWAKVLDGSLEPPSRAAHLEGVDAELDDAVGTDEDWWMAWDFTVASTDSLSARLRHIRDLAYEELGSGTPEFEVANMSDDGTVRTITGTYQVPLFLDSPEPGGVFTLDADGLPERGKGMFDANFICVAPSAPAEPARPIVYGHGLLGSADEVLSLASAVPLGNLAACATDWVGMSQADLGTVSAALEDLSAFPAIPDRLQQGHVNMSFLGRLLNDENGFAADPAFRDAAGAPVIAVGDTQFVGNSQGGILGGAASSVSTEWDRVVLGVPGINYSLLLTRSIDWDPFAVVFEAAYTDEIERVLALSVVQMLWDRGENDGYAQHLTTDPYEGIDAKDVLLVEAFGDHQVANVSTEILARTIGAKVHRPVLKPGRSDVEEPAWGIDSLPEDRTGSGLVVWDYGTPAPPPVNEAPREPEYGEDPHGAGVDEIRVLAQAFGFLGSGVIEDVCDGKPCTSDVMSG